MNSYINYRFSTYSVCRSLLCLLIAAGTLAIGTGLHAANIEVVEGQPSSVGVGSSVPSRSDTTTYSTGNAAQNYGIDDRPSDTQTELLLQLQVLQTEVMGLRGMLEEQAHQLDKLQQRRVDDYADLDRRISALTKSGSVNGSVKNKVNTVAKNRKTIAVASDKNLSSQAATVERVSSQPPVIAPIVISNKSVALVDPNRTTVSDSQKISVGDDDQGREVYKKAYDKVKNRKFDEAKIAMVAFVGDYPSHRYVPNAYFWIGELYYHDSDMGESKGAFEVLVEKYPEHRKVPDAKFKLAKILHQSGDVKKATVLLKSVVEEHASSRVAKPAQDYLNNSL